MRGEQNTTWKNVVYFMFTMFITYTDDVQKNLLWINKSIFIALI